MTDMMKTQYGSRITLLMEVLVEGVYKRGNYTLLCESFCALSSSRDRSSCVLNFLPFDKIIYMFMIAGTKLNGYSLSM